MIDVCHLPLAHRMGEGGGEGPISKDLGHDDPTVYKYHLAGDVA